jgi:hypothetical protein
LLPVAAVAENVAPLVATRGDVVNFRREVQCATVAPSPRGLA